MHLLETGLMTTGSMAQPAKLAHRRRDCFAWRRGCKRELDVVHVVIRRGPHAAIVGAVPH